MNSNLCLACLPLLLVASFWAAAQSSSGSSVITTPPRTMNSMGTAETPGSDSTMQGTVNPNAKSAAISYVLTPTGGSTFIPPPTITCTPGATTGTQTASCPAGTQTPAGSTTFTQTDTTTTTCPSGSYGSPNSTTSAWSPASDSTTCPQARTVSCTPSSSTGSQTASCPAGTQTYAGNSTFTQTNTTTTTCPSGSYGSPSTSTSAWTPASNTQTCPQSTPNQPPLPFNGQDYYADGESVYLNNGPQSGSHANIFFQVYTNGTWQITSTAAPYGTASPLATGNLPSTATAIMVVISGYTATDIDGAPTSHVKSANTLASQTQISTCVSSSSCETYITTSLTPNEANKALTYQGVMTITVYLYNAAGQVISTTTATFHVDVASNA